MEKKNITIKIYLTIAVVLLAITVSFAQYNSISFDGYDRTYLLHLPSGYIETESIPLVIAMHGGFGSAINLQNQSQLSVKADAENFIVVYPEGVKGGILNIRTWNAGWCCGNASNLNIDDVGFIDALLDTLISQYSIDTNRIYATGMSNGGFMSYRLACELSDRIAAISPVASSMSLISCVPSRPVPIIHFHSYLDTSVPYLGGIGDGFSDHYNPPQDSIMNAWANIDSCDILNDTTIVDNNQYTFTKWRDCNCSSEIHHYITQDGGHSWPGGNQTLIGDPVSVYIDATDLMWSFFQQYSLDCETLTIIKETYNDNGGLELFPNPSTGIINIRISDSNTDFITTVYDQLGKVILRSENTNIINLINQPIGIYYVSIQTEAQILTGKITKIE